MKHLAKSLLAFLFLFLVSAGAGAQEFLEHAGPAITTDKRTYAPGEIVGFVGTNWAPGEEVRIVVSGAPGSHWQTLLAKADATGAFRVTAEMPEAPAWGEKRQQPLFEKDGSPAGEGEQDQAAYRATATGSTPERTAETELDEGRQDTDGDRLIEQEIHTAVRQGYPTFRFKPEWIRQAAAQDAHIERRIPSGRNVKTSDQKLKTSPLSLSNAGFTALGPQPEHMTGCSGCFDYGTTAGRINDIKIDPTTTTQGSIVAYAASVGGGVWKTTNCCTASTAWAVTTDDPLISTTSIDSITIDPNNHNVIYAGTGDLSYGSFSMGSQGILKSVDAGAHWTVLGANIFGLELPQPVGSYPQYQSVGKVRVDPNNSNNVVAGTKTGLYFSYDAGANWTGPCLTSSFSTMRQDITALELSNMGGGVTRIIAAVGVRGFASPVQFNLDQNGANGIYRSTMGASGCPSFTSIASNANGFIFNNAAIAGSPYAANASLNAGSGTIYGGNTTTGNQLGRIDMGIAPSDPNVMYAQVQSIAPNSSSGCGGAAGCQLGVWATTDGGTTWSFMKGSSGGSLQPCTGAVGSGDYSQNWYDQAVTVDPNNPDRVFIDTFDIWFATRTGTAFYDVGCAYTPALVVHADQHALAFVPGSSSILLAGNDGGINVSTNADTAVVGTTRNTFLNIDGGLNTIEFYSGDISANFATSANPQIDGGAQDNGPSSATFAGSPTGPIQWQMGTGGDGFYARIDPVGTGVSAAQGTITLTTGGAVAGETFTIGGQVFTWQAAARAGTGQVQINSSTTTAGNNIVTAITADLAGVVTAVRSGATVVVTAATTGAAGNSIVFTEASTNMTMDGGGVLGGTYTGGFPALRFWEGNNSGGLSRCINNCTAPGATWTSKRGNWTSDVQAFQLPFDIFRGGIPGGDDCAPAGPGGGCGHMIAATTRIWETITANASGSAGTVSWYVNSVANLSKQTLGARSYINQVKFSPKYESVAMAGTNDGNVLIGFGLGSGSGPTAASGTITVSGTPVANQTFAIGSQTFTWRAASANTGGDVTLSATTATSAANIVTAITNTLAGVVTATRAGSVVTVTAPATGPAGNSIVFINFTSTGVTFNPASGTLAGGSAGVASWVDVTGGNTILANRPILGIALDPSTTAPSLPVGYAAVGGFDDLTPATPGHLFRVDCTASCASFTWTNKSGNLPNIPVDSVIVNPNYPHQVFAGTDFGLYYTDDITANPPVWYRFTAGVPNAMVWDMQIDRGATALSLWTRSRGAYAWPLPAGPLAPLTTALSVSPASGTYGGSPITLTATLTTGGNPVVGASVAFSLNGTGVGSATTNAGGVATLNSASLASVNAGSFPAGVTASFSGNSTYGASNGSAALTIAKATPTVTATGGTFTYNGSAQSGSGSATGGKGESLAVTLSYTGTGSTIYGPSATAPSGAGTYQVVAHTAGDSNNNSGDSSPAALTINKANPIVTASGGIFTYDGSAHTGGGSATGGAGESLTVTLSYTGTGSTTYGPSATAPTNAGTYQVVAHTAGDANNNAADSSPAALTINQATPTVTATGGTFTYNGGAHAGSGSATGGAGESLTVTLSYTGTGSTIYGPSATAPTNAGTYQVVAHTAGDANNAAADSAPAALTINKATATIVVTPYCVVFNGAAHTATGTATGVLSESLTGLVLSATTHTAAGTYTGDAWTFTNANYADANGTVTDGIVDATITAAGPVMTGTSASASVAAAGAGANYAWTASNAVITSGNGTNAITYTAGSVGPMSVSVTVTLSGGCSDSRTANLTVIPLAISVSNIAPAAGRIGGGSSVTITGSGFQNGATVTIGGNAATSVVVVSGTTITAVTPAHAAGVVNVTVTNPDSGTATLAASFTYLTQQFDPNGDATIDPSDIFYLVNYLFISGQAPRGAAGLMSGDANGDQVVDPADVFYAVNYLFTGGPAPMSAPPSSSVTTESSQRLGGTLSLGKPVEHEGHYVVPVLMTLDGASEVPQAMALRVRLTGSVGEASIRRAGAAKEVPTVFEASPRSGNALSYLVSFDQTKGGLVLGNGEVRSAVLAEIELTARGTEGFTLELDPAVTMLSNAAGSHWATVGNGSLRIGAAAAPTLRELPSHPDTKN